MEILLRTQWSRDDDLFDIAYPISECSGVGGTRYRCSKNDESSFWGEDFKYVFSFLVLTMG